MTFTEASVMGKVRKCPCGALARKGEACPSCGKNENEENPNVKCEEGDNTETKKLR